MKLLFIHQNFPGQFIHLAPALANISGSDIRTLTISSRPIPNGVQAHRYTIKRGSSKSIHPWISDLETKTIRGEAVYFAALQLKKQGYYPDIIFAHPGWGESLFLKDVWPESKLLVYCEYYYSNFKGDVGFDQEFKNPHVESPARLRMKNANHDLHLLNASRGLSPTMYQRSTFPELFQSKIDVAHDGIDTQTATPNPTATFDIQGLKLRKCDEVITFVNRNLEPLRGYHIFMRSLPKILRDRPNLNVVIVGGDDVSYGARSPSGATWKNIFLTEVSDKIDLNRVHFVGNLNYRSFIALLQISTVHVYLTYPFVLSWSLMEAMSCGCAIVASDTAPVKELITTNKTGVLIDFFDFENLSNQVIKLLSDAKERERLGKNARDFIIENYDLRNICLPQQLQWIKSMLRA